MLFAFDIMRRMPSIPNMESLECIYLVAEYWNEFDFGILVAYRHTFLLLILPRLIEIVLGQALPSSVLIICVSKIFLGHPSP